jgi:hypothetical protein
MSDGALTAKEIDALIDGTVYGFSPDEGTKAILDELIDAGVIQYDNSRAAVLTTVLRDSVYRAYKYGLEAGKRGK